MTRYLLTRLALMPLTLVLAQLVLFVILNLAPGRMGDADDPASTAERRASERVFREQFGLDRPMLINTRAWVSREEVVGLLDRAGTGAGAAAARARDAAEAELELGDLGRHAVPHLVEIVASDPPSSPRYALAAAHLALAVGRTPPEGWPAWWAANRAAYEARPLAQLVLDTRFARFWQNVLALDFGRSFIDRTPVLPAIVQRLQVSVVLGLVSILLAYALAIPIGVYSAARAGTPLDLGLTGVMFVLYAAPPFFVATVLLEVFAGGQPFRWFPPAGFASLDHVPRTTLDHLRDVGWHLVLPVLTYTAAVLAALSRYARAGVSEVIRADHVRTARAKGLPELVVLVRHVARNGMIPVLTLLGGLLPALVSGSVVIEVVFGVPGVGLYLYDAINLRDYNAVMGVLVIVSAATIVGTFASDVAVALADPRIRLDAGR